MGWRPADFASKLYTTCASSVGGQVGLPTVRKIACYLTDARRTCAACGQLPATGGQRLKRCDRCLSRWYCSAACQRADWRAGHKAVCRPSSRSMPDMAVLQQVMDAAMP